MNCPLMQVRKVLVFLLVFTVLVFGFALVPGAQAGNVKSTGSWTALCNTPGGLACLPEPREGANSVALDNMIIVTHGYHQGDTNDTRIYDIDTNTWYDPQPLPLPEARRSELAGAAHGGLVYAVGGRGGCKFGNAGVCSDLEVYDPILNAWEGLMPMPTPRAGLAAVVVGDKLFAVGGRTGFSPGTGDALDCLEAYDIEAGTWGPGCGSPDGLAPLPIPVMDTTASAHGNKIYVFGGQDKSGNLSTAVQIYNVAKNTWTLGKPMPTPRANLAAAACGNVLVVTGGRTASQDRTDIVEAYQLPKGKWFAGLKPMPTVKSEHGGVSHGGKIYAVGSGIFGQSLDVFEALKCSSLFRR